MGRVGGGEADREGACDNPQYGGVLTQQKASLPHVKSMVHGQVLTVQFLNSSINLKMFIIKWKNQTVVCSLERAEILKTKYECQ